MSLAVRRCRSCRWLFAQVANCLLGASEILMSGLSTGKDGLKPDSFRGGRWTGSCGLTGQRGDRACSKKGPGDFEDSTFDWSGGSVALTRRRAEASASCCGVNLAEAPFGVGVDFGLGLGSGLILGLGCWGLGFGFGALRLGLRRSGFRGGALPIPDFGADGSRALRAQMSHSIRLRA